MTTPASTGARTTNGITSERAIDHRDLALQDAAREIVTLTERVDSVEIDRAAYRDLALVAIERVAALTTQLTRARESLASLREEYRRCRESAS